MDKILNSKSFNLLKKSGPNLTSILLLAFLIWQDYINGEGNTFVVGVIVILFILVTITTIIDIALNYFLK